MGFDKLPEILTTKQLAEFLQVSDQTIKRAMKEERLKAFKIGRDWRIKKESAIEWIERGRK